ncbi:hypothetical protein BJF79_18810 [Actinomadura sp. CNU-125]|nr:hypothetical protein BJF79_18810 [Actinomadura sp. CNU-125]
MRVPARARELAPAALRGGDEFMRGVRLVLAREAGTGLVRYSALVGFRPSVEAGTGGYRAVLA